MTEPLFNECYGENVLHFFNFLLSNIKTSTEHDSRERKKFMNILSNAKQDFLEWAEQQKEVTHERKIKQK